MSQEETAKLLIENAINDVQGKSDINFTTLARFIVNKGIATGYIYMAYELGLITEEEYAYYVTRIGEKTNEI